MIEILKFQIACFGLNREFCAIWRTLFFFLSIFFSSLEFLKGSYVIKQICYSVLSKPACPELLQVPSNGVQKQSGNYWLNEHHSGQI